MNLKRLLWREHPRVSPRGGYDPPGDAGEDQVTEQYVHGMNPFGLPGKIMAATGILRMRGTPVYVVYPTGAVSQAMKTMQPDVYDGTCSLLNPGSAMVADTIDPEWFPQSVDTTQSNAMPYPYEIDTGAGR